VEGGAAGAEDGAAVGGEDGGRGFEEPEGLFGFDVAEFGDVVSVGASVSNLVEWEGFRV
jgi:hypothetical protein